MAKPEKRGKIPADFPGISQEAIFILILAVALFLYGWNMFSLASLDSAPPRWDEACHLKDSVVYFHLLSHLTRIDLGTIIAILNRSDQYPLLRPSGYYPPLAPLSTSLLYFVFGVSAKVAVMSNLVFLCLLVFSVYKIGTSLFSSRVAFVACLLILFFPIILKYNIAYYLDLPLTAMTALGIFVLIRSNDFKDRRYSIISGLVFGLGMLVKWTYVFFVAGPFGYAIHKSLFSKSSRWVDVQGRSSLRNARKNLFFLATAAIFVCGLYYLPLLSYLWNKAADVLYGVNATGPDTVLSAESLLFYPVALWKEMITPLGAILLGLGILTLAFSKNSRKMFVLAWMFVPYVLFTMIQTKNPRFMLPWLVAISLILSFYIDHLAHKTRVFSKKVRLDGIVISPILLLFFLSFTKENLRQREAMIAAAKENWLIDEMVSVLEKDLTLEDKNMVSSGDLPLSLGVLSNHQYINDQTLRYYTVLRRLPLNVKKVQTNRVSAYDEFVDQFDSYHYILIKDSSNTAISAYQPLTNKMLDYFYSLADRFDRLGMFPEPDGSTVSIYVKSPRHRLAPNPVRDPP